MRLKKVVNLETNVRWRIYKIMTLEEFFEYSDDHRPVTEREASSAVSKGNNIGLLGLIKENVWIDDDKRIKDAHVDIFLVTKKGDEVRTDIRINLSSIKRLAPNIFDKLNQKYLETAHDKGVQV